MEERPNSSPARRPTPGGKGPFGGYSWYALGILIICYLFNYVDRNILSILAEEVKSDLGLDDAQIGFLYGTAFAVFYAVFGIPFGRLADAWIRKNLIAIGLFFWSLMTAMTGTARTFGMLGAYRVGVGVGEASLSPSAYSLIVDYFPQRLRATALALYSSGIYLGAAVGFALGGFIVDFWNGTYPDGSAPLGLAAWQAAFLAVGLPGLLMAVWVWTLREPAKGQQEGVTITPTGRPEPFKEFGAVIPPFTVLSLWRSGCDRKGLLLHAGCTAALALLAWAMVASVGEPAQWIALAIGTYAAFSWGQGLAYRDPATFGSILGSRAFMYTCVGFASLSFVTNGLAFWTAPLLIRSFDASPTRVGALMGVGVAVGGWIGVTVGGLVSDRLKQRTPNGRVILGLATVVLSVPAMTLMLTATSLTAAFIYFLFTVALVSLWIGPGAAAANELVPPRMRSTASAIYLLLNTLIGFALGPFAVGKISDVLVAAGQSPADSLRYAMMLSMLFWAVSAAFLWRARAYVGPAEAALASAGVTGSGSPPDRS
ncbi:MAG: MFS transporter [Acidobacteria bacterium]|nr:MFS transporter [Acidobacteriota bacterium]